MGGRGVCVSDVLHQVSAMSRAYTGGRAQRGALHILSFSSLSFLYLGRALRFAHPPPQTPPPPGPQAIFWASNTFFLGVCEIFSLGLWCLYISVRNKLRLSLLLLRRLAHRTIGKAVFSFFDQWLAQQKTRDWGCLWAEGWRKGCLEYYLVS